MSYAKKLVSYSLAGANSPFNFTMNSTTGRIIVPEGVPVGTELRYVERQHFSDGTYEDSEWLTFVVK